MKPTVYLLPGLGADHRLFQPLLDLKLDIVPLDFIAPIKGESLPAYAARMAKLIDTSRPHILGGVSLGGIIASEIALITHPHKLLLISSVKNSREFPFYFRFGRYFPIHRLFSGNFLRKYAPRERYAGMTPSYRQILDDMRAQADTHFIEWALNAVVNWRRKHTPPNTFHVHGGFDLMFPPPLLRRGYDRIPRAGHTMVMTHATQVEAWLRQHLDLAKP